MTHYTGWLVTTSLGYIYTVRVILKEKFQFEKRWKERLLRRKILLIWGKFLTKTCDWKIMYIWQCFLSLDALYPDQRPEDSMWCWKCLILQRSSKQALKQDFSCIIQCIVLITYNTVTFKWYIEQSLPKVVKLPNSGLESWFFNQGNASAHRAKVWNCSHSNLYSLRLCLFPNVKMIFQI